MNKKSLLDYIDDQIKKNKLKLMFINKVLEVCKKNEGKKPTKRLANEIKKAFPNYTVHWDNEINYHIEIWGNGISMDDRFSALVAYKGSGEGFKYKNAHENIFMEDIIGFSKRYTLNKERNIKLELGKHKVSGLVRRWNEAEKELKEVEEIAERYELQYQFKLEV